MTANTATRPTFLYWLMLSLIPVNVVFFVWMIVDYVTHPLESGMYGSSDLLASPVPRAIFTLAFSPLFLATGILIMRRARGNVIGVFVTLMGLYGPSFGLRHDANPVWVAVMTSMIGIWWMSLFYMFLYFPDGRAYPRWTERWFNGSMVFYFAFGILSVFGQPILNTVGAPVYNPLFTPAMGDLFTLSTQVSYLTIPPLVIGVFLSPILRYRKAAPGSRERQQIKWLMFCAGFMAVYLIFYSVITATVGLGSPLGQVFAIIYYPFVVVFPPFALGTAIVRHKLYDIDIIIRRTLVYSILTTILGAIYFGGVVLIQRIFQAAVGQTPDVAIVISTLLIAGLFSPIRRQIQDTIDRRFYRRKYDAEKTLARFNATLRDEVDIEALKDSLVSVVQETMQPTHVALWIQPQSQGNMKEEVP